MRVVATMFLLMSFPVAAFAQKPAAAPSRPARASTARPATDPYVGTFAAADLIITLRRAPQGYSGMAQSAGGQYPVVARIVNGVLNGSYTDNGAQRTFAAVVQGDVMQLEADGTQFMLQRQGQVAQAPVAAPGQVSASAPARSAPVASTAQDQQAAQFLMANRWCSFAYNQTSGSTTTEQVQFNQDGTATRSGQRETQSSNPNGSYYGNSQNGDRGYWRVQGGQLMLSQDGTQWSLMPSQVTRNSNGYPILTLGGKEYSQCN